MKSCFHETYSIINITIHFRTKRQLRNIHKFEMVVIINFDGEKKKLRHELITNIYTHDMKICTHKKYSSNVRLLSSFVKLIFTFNLNNR